MNQNILYVGLDVDDTQYHGSAFNKDTTVGRRVNTIAVNPFFLILHDDTRWPPFLQSIGKSPEQLTGFELKLELPE
jgi:hypothetical protein